MTAPGTHLVAWTMTSLNAKELGEGPVVLQWVGQDSRISWPLETHLNGHESWFSTVRGNRSWRQDKYVCQDEAERERLRSVAFDSGLPLAIMDRTNRRPGFRGARGP